MQAGFVQAGSRLESAILKHTVRARTWLRHMPYGDQAIFVRADVLRYQKCDGVLAYAACIHIAPAYTEGTQSLRFGTIQDIISCSPATTTKYVRSIMLASASRGTK